MTREQRLQEIRARQQGFVAGCEFARQEAAYFQAEDQCTCESCGQVFWPTEGWNVRAIEQAHERYGNRTPPNMGGIEASENGRRPAWCWRCADKWIRIHQWFQGRCGDAR